MSGSDQTRDHPELNAGERRLKMVDRRTFEQLLLWFRNKSIENPDIISPSWYGFYYGSRFCLVEAPRTMHSYRWNLALGEMLKKKLHETW
jgi:hypothetical protein